MTHSARLLFRVTLTLAAAACALAPACVNPPAPAPPSPRAPATPATPAAPTAPTALPSAPGADTPAAAAVADAALIARVRTWLEQNPGMPWFRGAEVTRDPDRDTERAKCVRATANAAPDPMRASRLICVAGSEVLAGEPGLQRFLQLHQFDPTLAAPGAAALVELRDAMLGFGGRSYTSVNGRVEGDALVVDAEGAVKPGLSQRPRPARWRVTFRRDGTTSEETLPPAR